jgi:hypothetical protein
LDLDCLEIDPLCIGDLTSDPGLLECSVVIEGSAEKAHAGSGIVSAAGCVGRGCLAVFGLPVLLLGLISIPFTVAGQGGYLVWELVLVLVGAVPLALAIGLEVLVRRRAKRRSSESGVVESDSAASMVGFVAGGLLGTVGLMGAIGGLAAGNLGAATLSGIAAALGGGIALVAMRRRERDPWLQRDRAERFRRLVTTKWPDVLADLAIQRQGLQQVHAVELRPKVRAYLKARSRGLTRWQSILYYIFLIALIGPGFRWQWGLVGLGLAIPIVGAGLLWQRIWLDGKTLTIRELLRTRSFALGDIGAVIFTSVSFLGPSAPRAILLSHEGTKIGSFQIDLWDEDALSAAFTVVGLPPHGDSATVVPWASLR